MKYYFKEDANNIILTFTDDNRQHKEGYLNSFKEFTPAEGFDFLEFDSDGLYNYKNVSGVPTIRTTAEKSAELIAFQDGKADNKRKNAYVNESDPLYFKAIELNPTTPDLSAWTAKKAEIRLRHPKSTD